MSDDILYETQGGVARVTFNRPHVRNALTLAMYDRLGDICAALDQDRSVRVLVLAGAGTEAFAAGTEISEFRSFATPEDALAYEARIEALLTRLERCRVPTIAAIAGACTGGGAAIALCCDLRIGAANARFGFPIARTLGNCLSAANLARLCALIGPARVKDLIFTARLMDARQAHAAGLLTEVVDDPADVRERADEVARLIADHAPLTLKATKEALRRLEERAPSASDEDLVVMCYMSRDFKEGMEAFLDKRRPVWRGE